MAGALWLYGGKLPKTFWACRLGVWGWSLGEGFEFFDAGVKFFETTDVSQLNFGVAKRDGRGAEDHLFGANAFADSALGGDDGLVPDFDVADDADLASEGDIVAEFGASGDACLGDDEAVFSNDDIVGDLDEVIDFGTGLDPSAAEAGTVDGDVGTDFNIVVDLDDAGLGNFHVATGGEFEAEAIAAEDGAAMDDDSGAEETTCADGHAGGDLAIGSEDGVVADVGGGADEAIGADVGTVFDDDMGLDGNIFTEDHLGSDDGGGMDSWGESDGWGGEVGEELSESEGGIF